jgi:hypothetical protein
VRGEYRDRYVRRGPRTAGLKEREDLRSEGDGRTEITAAEQDRQG